MRLLALILLLSGCEGSIISSVSATTPTSGLHAQCVDPDAIAQSDRLTRLTHAQYSNIVRDTLGLSADTSSFTPDPSSGGFSNNAVVLQPSDLLVRDWSRTAEELATLAVSVPANLTRLAPCSGGQTQACFNTFVAATAQKLYRHPPSSAQLTKLQGAWAAAGPLYPSGTAYQKAVRMALEAMLQSPAFLYRAELSSATDAKGGIPLGGYEVAERLSFALWSSSPDDTLLQAAANGQLATRDQVRTQAARMMNDPKARTVMRDFYFQWLLLAAQADLSRNTTLFPAFNRTLGPAMQEESQRFLEDLTFDTSGTFKDVWTSPHTFIDGSLGALYGVTVPGTGVQRIELDATKRAGLLTQLGFLATHSYADIDSPIHRGAYVLKRLMCAQFSPPGGIDVELPALSPTLKTTRQRVDAHTSAASCHACHGVVNPVGFAFEHFDAVGQWRDVENGVDVDATGALPSPDAVDALTTNISQAGKMPSTAANGAIALSALMATHQTAQRCFSAMWLRYLYARLDFAEDACTLQAVGDKLATPGYTLKDGVLDLVSARAFTTRVEVAP